MARFLNTLFLTLAAFALAFCWFYYYTKLVVVSCLCAFLISFAICLIIYALLKIKGKKYYKQAQKKNAEKLKNYLALSTDNKKLVLTLLRKNGYTASSRLGGITAEKNAESYFVYLYLELVKPDEIVISRAVRLCKKYRKDNLMIFSTTFSPHIQHIADKSGLSVKLFDIVDLYSMLEKEDLLPNFQNTRTIKKADKFLSLALCKERASVYLLACISLVFFSVISFYPIYTLVFATIQLFLAIFSKVNKKYNNAEAEKI